MPSHIDLKRPGAWLSLAAFVIVVVTVGGLIGAATRPGPWYAELQKPFFNPPSWVFAPAWTLLYILIAIAGWRIWSLAPRSRAMATWAMTTWAVQMLLNWGWSPVFFGMQSPRLALVVVVALLAAIVLFMVQAGRLDKAAAWLFAPYAAWVAFATVLNASIVLLNP